MKRIILLLVMVVLAGSVPLMAETVEGVLIDAMCCGKIFPDKGYAGVKAHTKDCALMPACVKSGLGVITEAGKFYKLDAAGQEKAIEALKSTAKKDNLTVKVEGKVEGNVLTVESLNLT